jgi:flavin reductase (DIM6/NTAB) family NADH-FMN oxidoreductase RutF
MEINLMDLEPRHAHDLLTSCIIPRPIAWVSSINIHEVPEFVVNIVSVDLLSIMEFSAKPLPYGSDEHSIKGIHWIPSKKIRPCRVQEARISFECILKRIVAIGEGPDAGNLILGGIKLVHLQDDLLKNGREVDWLGLDVLGRLSGNRYCAIRSVIESESN